VTGIFDGTGKAGIMERNGTTEQIQEAESLNTASRTIFEYGSQVKESRVGYRVERCEIQKTGSLKTS
jgi:hypothetical protein